MKDDHTENRQNQNAVKIIVYIANSRIFNCVRLRTAGKRYDKNMLRVSVTRHGVGLGVIGMGSHHSNNNHA